MFPKRVKKDTILQLCNLKPFKMKLINPYYVKSVTLISFVFISAMFCLSSCQKNDHTPSVKNTATLNLYLTDDPADYKEVWVDIQQAKVQFANDSSQGNSWQNLALSHPGKYDLLSLRNGVDTLFASGIVPAGKVSAITLTLGDNNSLVFKDGQTVPLVIATGSQKQLTLQIENVYLKADTSHALVLDFDAAQSVLSPGSRDSGDFVLSPIIRVFEKGAGASIDGWVYPAAAQAHVEAISHSGETLVAIPDNITGFYKFWGIPEDTYTLNFIADTTTGYQPAVLKNIYAIEGKDIRMDTVVLHK